MKEPMLIIGDFECRVTETARHVFNTRSRQTAMLMRDGTFSGAAMILPPDVFRWLAAPLADQPAPTETVPWCSSCSCGGGPGGYAHLPTCPRLSHAPANPPGPRHARYTGACCHRRCYVRAEPGTVYCAEHAPPAEPNGAPQKPEGG